VGDLSNDGYLSATAKAKLLHFPDFGKVEQYRNEEDSF
jgi:hypothetical protein